MWLTDKEASINWEYPPHRHHYQFLGPSFSWCNQGWLSPGILVRRCSDVSWNWHVGFVRWGLRSGRNISRCWSHRNGLMAVGGGMLTSPFLFTILRHPGENLIVARRCAWRCATKFRTALWGPPSAVRDPQAAEQSTWEEETFSGRIVQILPEKSGDRLVCILLKF